MALNVSSATQDLKAQIRSHLPVLLTSLLGVAVLVLIPIIHNFVTKLDHSAEYTRIKESPIALNKGLQLAASEASWDAAWASLQRALQTALTARARLDAMLAIGEQLATRAQRNPAEYALPARQYLRAVYAQDARPDRQLRARLGLLTLAILRQEVDEVREACADIHQIQVPEQDKAALLLTQLDAMLPLGEWDDIHALLQELLPYRLDPRLGTAIQLRWITAHEQVLTRPAFWAAWQKNQPAAGAARTAAELRKSLVASMIAQLDDIATMNGPASEEAKFKAFRLAFREGQFPDASRRLDAIHLNHLGPFSREALLLAVDLARQESHLIVFQNLVLQYVSAYDLDADIEPAFFEALNLKMSGGKGVEGLAILEQQLEQNLDPELRARLLLYTGNLARKLQHDDVAERCFAAILNMPNAQDYHATALLNRGVICADQGDMAAACQWLIRYLNRFPNTRAWDDTALHLFTKLGAAPEKAGADLIVAALLLSKRNPYDPNTLDVLLMTAKRLEALGLTSLAHDYYNRITLLQPNRNTKQPPANQEEAPVPPAVILANARCLLDLDRKVEADRLLRNLCSDTTASATRSEAALLWAGLALARGQKQEGERRLGLIDLKRSDTNVVWQAKVTLLILRVESASLPSGAVTELMAAIQEPAANAYPELVRQAFQTCFTTLAAKNDTAGLRSVLAAASAGTPAATQEEYRLQIAKQFLSRKDYSAAAEWLQNAPPGLSNAVAAIAKNSQLLRKIR
jgi:hypothetical protein